jgi:hypothetical protein
MLGGTPPTPLVGGTPGGAGGGAPSSPVPVEPQELPWSAVVPDPPAKGRDRTRRRVISRARS